MADNVPEYSVTELSGAIKRTVEDAYGYVRVRGELGRVSRSGNGHCYLDLKDDRAVLSSVIWKGSWSRLTVKPEQGMEVVATGRLTTFPGQSRYQLVIDTLEPAGAGALMAMLEARKKQLHAEGLFAAERKKPLPKLPKVIGVVTSPTGAVIRDILHRLRDRFPSHVIVWPTVVQGAGAAKHLVAGIEGFNRLSEDSEIPRPDVLIVGRGGGSLEDLWEFNDEAVVRAVAASHIPVISAVGHETDTTLIDYAADVRAPTPTAAAEMAVPVRVDILNALDVKATRLSTAIARGMERRTLAFQSASRGLGRPENLMEIAEQRFDTASEKLSRALAQRVERAGQSLAVASGRLSARLVEQRAAHSRERLEGHAARLVRVRRHAIENGERRLEGLSRLLESLSYKGVLDRGFALVTDTDGNVVRRAEEAIAGASVHLRFGDGERQAQILDGGDEAKSAPTKKRALSARSKKTPPKTSQKSTTDQANLFDD